MDTGRILETEKKKDTRGFPHYMVPLHEFLRAVIYGDNVYYDPLSSSIANLFDINTPDGREHFLLSILIEYISNVASSAGIEGFVRASMIYEFAQSLGFTPTQISFAIARALRKNLIETEARRTEESESTPRLFRTTTVGVYHTRRLIRQFTYVDAMIVDTPVLDNAFRDQIANVEPIDGRLNRALIFASYLDNQWEKMNQKGLGFDWKNVSKELKINIETIRKRISDEE